MPWQDINPYKVGLLGNAAVMVALKGNIEYLKTPNYAEYHHPGTGGDYTLAGVPATLINGSADIDSTNFSLTVTSYGGPILAMFYGMFSIAAVANASLRVHIIRVDPISHLGRNMPYNFTWETSRSIKQTLGGFVLFNGLPAGTHTFRAIWLALLGDATLYVANRPYFAVVAW